MRLTAILYPDEETNWIVAECPEIGVASQGKSEISALKNLKEAIELFLESFPNKRPKKATVKSFSLAHA